MADNKPAALVTGSATGIGRAEAIALAAAGYDVAVNYSRSQAAAEETAASCAELGAKTVVIACDVADDTQVKAMVAEVASTFGRLDVLCNNAGITSTAPFKDLDAIDLDEWDRVMSVNVRSIVQVTRACAQALRETKGAIVNTASIVGLRPGDGCDTDQGAALVARNPLALGCRAVGHRLFNLSQEVGRGAAHLGAGGPAGLRRGAREEDDQLQHGGILPLQGGARV